MLHLDELAPCTPRLPRRRSALTELAASAALHATLVAVVMLLRAMLSPISASVRAEPLVEQQPVRLVFVAPGLPRSGGGGGGGGNQQPGPIRRAQGIGPDAITLRTKKTPSNIVPSTTAASDTIDALPSVVLDARPLASGMFEQTGLPVGVMVSPSTGPGTGGGVGTGTGTGIGSGSGPGLGPGSGGGTGGGAYRPDAGVSAPRVIKQVRPSYTPEALRNKIQGTVILELVVTSEGYPSRIRVVRSLDPGGLDEGAVATVAQWRFEPGRLDGTAVDVRVTVWLDFTLR